MKLRPGEVPQCPSSRGLMCSGRSGSRSRVFLQIDLANCQIIGRLPVAVQALEAVWIEVSHTVYSLVGAYSKRNWA
jgi:hypothetical protein